MNTEQLRRERAGERETSKRKEMEMETDGGKAGIKGWRYK